MNNLDTGAEQWLLHILGTPFKAVEHAYSHQDKVYRIKTSTAVYYLKISSTLTAERENLKKLKSIIRVPEVIDFYHADGQDYLLISELPGKNLVELMGNRPIPVIVGIFAKAVKQLHDVDPRRIFAEAQPSDVLLHGDMALPNIILSDQDDIGYIDFGQLSYGSPELDITDAIWSLQRNLGPDYGTLFLEKYGPHALTPKITKALAYRHNCHTTKE